MATLEYTIDEKAILDFEIPSDDEAECIIQEMMIEAERRSWIVCSDSSHTSEPCACVLEGIGHNLDACTQCDI